MRGSMRMIAAGSLVLATAAGAVANASSGAVPELAYSLTEGQNLNAFVRDGKVAAHLLLRNGSDPRILVAFPAGNSGVGLWFAPVAKPATWRLDQPPRPITLADGKGRPLYGVEAVATIDAPRLALKQAVLSNVRFLRDYQAVGRFPPEVATPARIEGARIVYARDRADGAPGYRLELEVLGGRIDGGAIVSGADGRIRLRIVAASGDTPLTGLTQAELLNANAAKDPAARAALAFLSYREKFLAGSWRFNTYFGRDTLMSVRLLMPALRPAAVEAGIGAVLARLSAGGEVAHEEGIGEFAVLQNRKAGRSGDAAELDYGMVDDDFMLAPVVADYLAGRNRRQASAYLATPLASEALPAKPMTTGAALVRNLRFVVERASAFAAEPVASRLIPIKPGRMSGEWRDSDEGLGRGIYAYDVNAALVPAALEAIDALLRAGALDPYLTSAERVALGRAGAMARVWRARAAPLFTVELSAADAGRAIRAYASDVGIRDKPALTSLGGAPMVFHALSLDASGRPVPIVNSDEGFALLFGLPTPSDLERYVGAIMRPFPAGLMTDAGLLVANPVFAGKDAQARFTAGAYHGTVVWSWQQALLAAGLERQLARRDLPDKTRRTLVAAQTSLWRAIRATSVVRGSELWSWAYRDGRFQVVPFGAGKADVDESNAAQLWSTVYLAVTPPAPGRKSR